MKKVVRTRMAPSPTGEYHVGHIRTVMYDYAYAKQQGGKFVMRIEDTDRTRYVEGATERILNIVKEMGFDWDEGPIVGGPAGPYVQSEKLPVYKQYAEELVNKGVAYYCFCSPERLDSLREEQAKQGLPVTKYDKHCLSLSKSEVDARLASGEKYVIRLDVPSNKTVTFHDVVLGDISYNTNDIDDQVLLKSDGFPTYHLAVVVDDHIMEITHIMRGVDWLPSTPKHVLLYEAFGWDLPVYAHLPNLKEVGGSKKLSKRFGSVSVEEFLSEGYLPEALNNFLMFLGWNPGTEKEIYSMEEFIKDFSLEKIQHTDLVAFDREKLLWYNGYYIRNLTDAALLERVKKWANRQSINLSDLGLDTDPALLIKIIGLVKERMHKLSEFKDLTGYFLDNPVVDQSLLVSQTKDAALTAKILETYTALYESVSDSTWTQEYLDKISHDKLAELGWKPREAFMTLRVALAGTTATPPLFAVMEVLGKKVVLDRLILSNNSLN